MVKFWISAVCVVASLMATAQTDKPPDPKELAAVQRIRTRIEEQSKKAPAGPAAAYKVTIPNTTVSFPMVPIRGGEFRMDDERP